MEQSLFLPAELDFILSNFHYTSSEIKLNVISSQVASQCPICQSISTKVHSRYLRMIGDLPVSGKVATINLQVRKFFCENSVCIRKIFSERFKQQLKSYARRFERLNELLSSMGLDLGGNVAHRVGKLCFVRISASTILRLVIKSPIQAIVAPKIIGVDDWAFKKRMKYGTIIVDLEKNKVIELLPDREAKTLSRWLEQHPSVEIVSRDRSSTYASAITEANKNIVQIADRWHILANLTEGFEQFLNTQRQSIKEVAVELKSTNAVEAAENPPPVVEIENDIELYQGQSMSKYHDKYSKTKQLQIEGHSKRNIAKLLEISRNTVMKYWNMTSFLPKIGKKRNNLLDYEDYLIRRWNEGEQTVKNLYAEIREKGFKYKIRSVYELMQGFPRTVVNIIPELVKVKYYSSKQLSIWLGTFRKDWSDELPKAYLAKLIDDNPIIRKVRNAVLNFKRFMKDKTGEKLVPWCKNIIDDEAEHIKRFARGVLNDYQAVYQGFESNWSNGPVEGQVNRLKTIKRQMYGRASFELLRKRVVITSKR